MFSGPSHGDSASLPGSSRVHSTWTRAWHVAGTHRKCHLLPLPAAALGGQFPHLIHEEAKPQRLKPGVMLPAGLSHRKCHTKCPGRPPPAPPPPQAQASPHARSVSWPAEQPWLQWEDTLPTSQGGSVGARPVLAEALSSATAGATQANSRGSAPQAHRTQKHGTSRLPEPLATRDSASLSGYGKRSLARGVSP